jgi:A/G-specific adenine glycosylase
LALECELMAATFLLNRTATGDRFRHKLLAWYSANRRKLPWRETRDPYRIWVSEIMLQQTRVAAVLDHYRRFLKQFPSVRALARAKESGVLAVWSGLGYYRRARMLHAAARIVADECSGRVPDSAEALRKLPGIGRYTANAIASIAFAEPVPVVDGNVERVLSRILGASIAQAELWSTAQKLLDPAHPGDFNQALMELGATVCLPGVPECHRCPVKSACSSRGKKQLRRTPAAQRLRNSASLKLVVRRQAILLRQRLASDRLMPGMWELPKCVRAMRPQPQLRLKHSITNTDWTINVYSAKRASARSSETWVPLKRLSRLPLTGLTRKILRRMNLLA